MVQPYAVRPNPPPHFISLHLPLQLTPRKEKGSYPTPLKELQQNTQHGDGGCLGAEHKADNNISNLRP